MKHIHKVGFEWWTKDILGTPSLVMDCWRLVVALCPKIIKKGDAIPPEVFSGAGAKLLPPDLVSYSEAYLSSLGKVILKNPVWRKAAAVPTRCTGTHSFADTGMRWTYCTRCGVQGYLRFDGSFTERCS
jgi:hypothetical protein